MKKLTLFLLLTIHCCWICSQNTLKITNEHLKIANLIFAEHEYQTKLIPFLQQQIDNLKIGLIQSDSIYKSDILRYKQIIDIQNSTIIKLNNNLDTKNKLLIGTTACSIILFLLCLK